MFEMFIREATILQPATIYCLPENLEYRIVELDSFFKITVGIRLWVCKNKTADWRVLTNQLIEIIKLVWWRRFFPNTLLMMV